MSKKTETITVTVSVPPWSDAAKSWYLLTKRSENGVGWSGGSWFPKSACQLDLKTGDLTVPKWLYEKKKAEGVVFTKSTK